MRTMNHRRLPGACARILLASLALLACLFTAAGHAETDGMLRVKLARLGSPAAVQLVADCDYALASDASIRIPAGREMTISADGSHLTLTVADQSLGLGESARLVRSQTGNHGAQFISPGLSNRFCGDLSFSASSGVVTTLLHIYVEDYLYGVVGYEMGPSSGLEALKAQAIVARNYALQQKAARSSSAYDLSDSGDALNFRGYSDADEYADAVRAVDATRGQALYYGDGLATCYYCDSNGGQIESTANALGTSLPYSEVRDDPFDYDGAGTRKTATLRKDCGDLNPSLAQALTAGTAEQLGFKPDSVILKFNTIEDITPGEARYDAPSRLYTALLFHLNVTAQADGGEIRTGSVTVSVPTYGGLEDWYELGINDQDNETVWVSQTDRAFEITFRRHGSGLGMSKRGAQVMAHKDLSCWDILEFYYPGVSLRQLSLADGSQETESARATPSADPIAAARLGQKARLYERADEASGALTTLPAGANIDIYAVQGGWAAIGSGGLYGYINTDAITSFALTGVTAAQVKNDTLARVSAPSVEMLQLPVGGAKVLLKLSDGDTVQLDAYTDDWALVTVRDVEGFIPRSALTLQADGAADGGEIVTVSGEMTALLTESAALYVNADDSVAPRQQLEKGGYVHVLAYNQVWAYVRAADGSTGYVKLDRLSAVEAPSAAGGEALGEIVKVKGKQYRVVNVEALPLYERWSTDSQVLAILEKGKRVQLGAYSGDWACVRADGVTGFVSLSALTGAEDEKGEDADQIEGGKVVRVKGEQYATVTAQSTVLYATWSTSSEALASLSRGDRVRLGAYNEKWACVRAGEITGFVPVEALALSGE